MAFQPTFIRIRVCVCAVIHLLHSSIPIVAKIKDLSLCEKIRKTINMVMAQHKQLKK